MLIEDRYPDIVWRRYTDRGFNVTKMYFDGMFAGFNVVVCLSKVMTMMTSRLRLIAIRREELHAAAQNNIIEQ